MSRNRGSSRGGGGGGHTSPPPASGGANPAPGPATAPAGGSAPVTPTPAAPTPPAPPAEEAPEELRSFEEGGGEVIPRKYLGWGALALLAGIALYAIPWGKWWENGVGNTKMSWLAAGVAVWLIAFGYFLYKKDSRVWVLLAITAFLWWADQPHKGGAPIDKPAVERKTERRCFEVRLPESGETNWIKDVPICAGKVYLDGTKPFEILFLGGSGGWKRVGPETDLGRNSNTFKLRRLKGIEGEAVVKIAYDD